MCISSNAFLFSVTGSVAHDQRAQRAGTAHRNLQEKWCTGHG